MREIALDTETTGLDPYAGHRLVEIGCVELINHVKTGNHFHIYLNPERDMPKEAENVHGLSIEFLKDKPLFRSMADAFLEFIQDSKLVIHNAGFDMKFLNAELEKLGYPQIPMSQSIDTVTMARKMFPGSPANLDALCKRFNIDLSARVKHGALLDAELLADVYLELRGGRQSKMALKNEEANAQDDVKQEKMDIPQRSFSVSQQELDAHAKLREKIKDPVWEKYLGEAS
ncbi:MAG: DNA polymerase III subunit epsilon [Rickettsiales bacterium]|nr:DNA polymerase III subunit epsilon [Rickettsiales bacterium]